MAQITLNSTGVASNGSLVLQSNGTTVAVTIDTAQNFGLGVTPSANAGQSTLSISNYNRTFSALTMGSNANSAGYVGYNMGNTSTSNTWKYISADTGSALYFAGNEFRFMQFASGSAGATTSGTQAMTLDASGRLLVGLTSSIASNGIAQIGGNTDTRLIVDGSSTQGIYFTKSGADNGTFRVDGSGNYNWFVKGSGSANMTLDSSGNLLVGATSSYGGERVTIDFTGSGQRGMVVRNTTSTTQDSVAFVVNSTFVGWISASTTGTAYNTISDYRLKNTVTPMTGALAKVALLKPITYKWNLDGSDGQGFIAHELAEVVPHAVTGEKDAVDADGNPKYQGIDTSFLVATLTAAIKEQQTIIQSLTARITALESA